MKVRWQLLLSVLALCALMTGCTPGSDGPAADTSADTPTLTALQYELDSQAIDFAGLWFYDQLEQRTGIHVVFDEVKQADWDTKVNLMFASGDLRDMVLRGSLDLEEYGVTQHLLLPLDDYLADHMPTYAQRLDAAGLTDSTRSSDGQIYETGFLLAQDVAVNGQFFLNKTWLDRLGLAVPTTVTELTDVLRAFRDQDPNGNGLADEIPYQAMFDDNNSGLYNAFSFWGVPLNDQYFYIGDDGIVRHPAFKEGFRACTEWLHQLYTEKLLDPECITQSSNLWAAKVNLDVSGMFSYWRLTNTALKESVAEEFTCVLPVHAEGYTACLPAITDVIEFGAALTTSNRDPESSLRWLDAQMETETMMVSQNGPMSDMLRLNGDGKYEIAYVPENNALYDVVPVICGQFFAPADYYAAIYTPAPHRQEKHAYSEMYKRAGVLEKVPYQVLSMQAARTSAQNRELTQLLSTQKQIVKEFLVHAITQGVTDESWDAFLLELRQGGAEEYIALNQQVYDASLRKAGEVQ